MFWFLFAVVTVLGMVVGYLGAEVARLRRESDRVVRDRRIAELETDLEMNLPALRTIQPDANPLTYVLGVLAGCWITQLAQRRRRPW